MSFRIRVLGKQPSGKAEETLLMVESLGLPISFHSLWPIIADHVTFSQSDTLKAVRQVTVL